jgi:hypothetical protein
VYSLAVEENFVSVSHNLSGFVEDGFEQFFQGEGIVVQINDVARGDFLNTGFQLVGCAKAFDDLIYLFLRFLHIYSYGRMSVK